LLPRGSCGTVIAAFGLTAGQPMRDVLCFAALVSMLSLLEGVLTPFTSPRTMGGPALITLYMAVGFSTVGVFGLLSSLVSILTGDAGLLAGWRYGAGATGAAGVLFLPYIFV